MIRGQQNTQVKCLEHNPDLLRSAYKTYVVIGGENQCSEVVVRLPSTVHFGMCSYPHT